MPSFDEMQRASFRRGVRGRDGGSRVMRWAGAALIAAGVLVLAHVALALPGKVDGTLRVYERVEAGK